MIREREGGDGRLRAVGGRYWLLILKMGIGQDIEGDMKAKEWVCFREMKEGSLLGQEYSDHRKF